ncbi:Transcription initiation factor TFIID subunit 7 [Armadillidium nasatum]|uniref:Transcription initiation factor TFIID subunit 7 n=1 Tax=Armadillidium nasatum TaxID=96803 RepID=A0A5N5SYT6_9CRUS|nr:Transcription initiation factor TFIID subunit 7 [Armadillidium nasatum]
MQKALANRAAKIRQYKFASQNGPELENHFILRLLEPQAEILREDIRQGQTNIKDRLFIQLDYTPDKDDMRNGIITFDTIMYKARLYDLPTIMETWKTIDGKNFYKTADVCQMLMVRERDDPPEEEDAKKKKRDPNKVDKKFLYPHGYTPPLKNVRKRRFRKTLRKKVSNLETLDLPDIEKEVKRLLRTDNEAFSVRWEVVREDEEKKSVIGGPSESNLDKQQLFGELSSSDEEIGTTINIIDEDEDSRMSVDDSHQSFMNEAANSPSSKVLAIPQNMNSPLVTEFNPSMFRCDTDSLLKNPQQSPSPVKGSPSKDKLYAKLSHLESDMTRLLSQKAIQQADAANIENFALKQKFLAKLSDLESQIEEKEKEIKKIKMQISG